MNPLALIRSLVDDLDEEFHRYHAGAQVRRFASTFLAAFALQLLGGAPVMSWGWVWSLACAAAWVAARQVWPTVPWSKVRGNVDTMISEFEINIRRSVTRGAQVRTPTLTIPVRPMPGGAPTAPPVPAQAPAVRPVPVIEPPATQPVPEQASQAPAEAPAVSEPGA